VILFLDDWNKYPNAIADYNTSNKSFVRLAALYRDMGIKNYSYILSLLNPALQGVDPYSPDLTLDQMAMIVIECKLNFWYFLREVARAPGVAGGKIIPIRANRGNIAAYWLFFNHITAILIQPRQTGKSFSVDVLMVYLLNIRCTNTQINLLTKDERLRNANIARLKEIDLALPYYIRKRTKKDTDNTENFTVKMMGNSYYTHLPQTSPKLAENVGRGLTSPIFQIDEISYLPNIAISLPVALAAGGAARDIARENAEPYGTVITTTAGKKDDRDGKFAYNFITNSTMMTERLYDTSNLDQLENIIKRNSISDNNGSDFAESGVIRVNCTYNHRQLGYSDDWMRRKLSESTATGEIANRDMFNVWTSGNQSHPLDLKMLEAIRSSQADEYYGEISPIHAFITRWYIDENEIDQYMDTEQCVMALDTSDASGGDDISLIIMNSKDGSTVAAGNYNDSNLLHFTEWLFSWFVRFPKLICIIERRSTGAMIIDLLIAMMVSKGIDPFRRLFNRVVNDKDEFPDRYKEVSMTFERRNKDTYIRFKKTFGFATSSSGLTSRTELYSTTLQSCAKTVGIKARDKRLIDQVAGLTSKSGRVDHEVGEHDDLVIAWLLAYWLITQGKNLNFYELNSRSILSTVRNSNANLTVVEQYDMAEQNYVRDKLDELYQEMLNERDPLILRKYEDKVKVLANRIILEENEKFSVDDFMKSLEDEKRISRSQRKAEPSRIIDESLMKTHIREDLFTGFDPYRFYRN
jgi:hypothetical protein